MKRGLFIVIALIFGVKYGIDYLFSQKFQDYGDRTKAPWTCEVNNTFGHLFMVFSRYNEGLTLFKETLDRCPELPSGEVAQFEIAECLSKMGRNRDAVDAYRAFAEKYKGTKRAKIAERAADLLQVS